MVCSIYNNTKQNGLFHSIGPTQYGRCNKYSEQYFFLNYDKISAEEHFFIFVSIVTDQQTDRNTLFVIVVTELNKDIVIHQTSIDVCLSSSQEKAIPEVKKFFILTNGILDWFDPNPYFFIFF